MRGELSLRMKEILLEAVSRHFGVLDEIRFQIHDGNHELLTTIATYIESYFPQGVESLQTCLPTEQAAALAQAVKEKDYGKRIRQITIETIYGEPLSPPLKVLSEQEAVDITVASSGPVHAILVEQLPNVCNEMYPLMMDAYIHDLEMVSARHRTVVCAHGSWLTDDLSLTRGIVYLPEYDELVEMPFSALLDIDLVQFLCVSPGAHEAWSQKFEDEDIPILNPYSRVAVADDKYACYQQWMEHGVSTPEAVCFSGHSVQDDVFLLTEFKKIFHSFFPNPRAECIVVLQPNSGTEGRGTRAFRGPASFDSFLEANVGFYDHALEIASRDSLLIRKGIGHVCIRDPLTDRDVLFDIRVNVIDGVVESGFMMLAKSGEIVSSPGCGGRVVELKTNEAFKLRCENEEYSLALCGDDWQRIEEEAVSAVACFPGLRMVGVDVRLGMSDGRLIPWILDINPRPAGLSHSRYIHNQVPGVTQRLWKKQDWID